MTGPRTDRDVDQLLSAWMEDVAPDRPPTTLLEGAFAQTMRSTQVRRYPWQRAEVDRPVRALPRAGLWLAAVALLLLAIIAAAVMNGGGGLPLAVSPSPTSSPTPRPTSTIPTVAPTMALPAATSVTPEATVPLKGPLTIVASGSALWVLAPGRIDRIDPATNAVTGSVAIGSPSDLYNGMAANPAGLWATNNDQTMLVRVDPAALKVAKQIPAGHAPKGVLANADGVWVADVHYGDVLRFDPATDALVATTVVGPIGTSGPNWLGAGLGSIWVDVPNDRTVVRIDPVTNVVQATISTPSSFTPCGGFAIATSAVWVSGCTATTNIARIDPTSNTVVAIVELGGYGNPTLIGGLPWISVDTGTPGGGILVRIDPATNTIDRVLAPTTTFGGGGDILIAAGSVWVVDGYNDVVDRLPLAAFTS